MGPCRSRYSTLRQSQLNCLLHPRRPPHHRAAYDKRTFTAIRIIHHCARVPSFSPSAMDKSEKGAVLRSIVSEPQFWFDGI